MPSGSSAALTALASFFLVLPALDRHAAAMVARRRHARLAGLDPDGTGSHGRLRPRRRLWPCSGSSPWSPLWSSRRAARRSATPGAIDPDPGDEIDARPFAARRRRADPRQHGGPRVARPAPATTARRRSAARRSRGSQPGSGRRRPRCSAIRIGLEPGRRQAPVRSSLVAVAIGAAAIVGSLVYTSSAQTPAGDARSGRLDLGRLPLRRRPGERHRHRRKAADWPEVEADGHLVFFTALMLLGEEHELTHVLAFSTGPGCSRADRHPRAGPRAAAERDPPAPHLADDLGPPARRDLMAGTMPSFDEETGRADRPAPPAISRWSASVPCPSGDGNFDDRLGHDLRGLLSFLPGPEMAARGRGRPHRTSS